ncbi:MAG: T9SS type A sorting domain-containing protein [Bacteroidia bacterium]
MKKNALLSLSLVLCTIAALAQSPTQTHFTFKKAGEVVLHEIEDDFAPVLRHLEAPTPGTESTRAYLELLKDGMPEKKYGSSNIANKRSTPPTPFVLRNFKANPYRGIPNDNSMAISNGGMIISCINSTFHVYDTDGNLLEGKSLNAIGQELEVEFRKYDPRVIYDPNNDRFVMTYLNGSNPDETVLTIGFSKTNDPTDGWNLYTLPGNPLDDDSWSDYPMISLTGDELFYTINLLRDREPGEDWRQTFKQTVIWQVNLEDGYNGDEIETKLWSDINFGNKPIRNLHPVKGGSDIYGPNMYFLSTRNFDLENDTIFFLEITGTQDDENTKLIVDYLISDVAYGVPPNASQNQTALELQTNDARVLDGFLEGNEIVFALNSIDTSNNFAAIYFGHISSVSSNPSLKGTIYGNDSLEFGYPGLAWVGDDENFEAILCMNHSSSTIYPGCGVAYYNGNSLSNYKYVREGKENINILGGAERWGDYIGMQPKFDEIGICWMAGTFGKSSSGVGTEYGTWVAEIQKYGYNSTPETNTYNSAAVFPNPVNQNIAFVTFELDQTQYMSYDIYSTNGQLVGHIYNRVKTKKGTNEFSFNTSTLQAGTYLITIKGDKGFSTSKQFIVE